MGDFIKALTGGFSKIVYAWVLPSAISLGVFVFVVLPDLATSAHAPQFTQVKLSQFAAIGAFALATLSLAAVMGNGALPVYRVLEGYALPRSVRKRLLRRRLREVRRLRMTVDLLPFGSTESNLAWEKLQGYPEREDALAPTRLGNALRAFELYGDSRYGLDSQSFYYELLSLAPEPLRSDVEDTRATVDFFVGGVAFSVLLSTSAVVTSVVSQQPSSALVAVVAAVTAPLCYRAAISNVADWRYAYQAIVNVGRAPLASAVGLQMPRKFLQERQMWQSFSGLVHYGPDEYFVRQLDRRRLRYPKAAAGQDSVGSSPGSTVR